MSLPELKRDWSLANEFKRSNVCRVCGKVAGQVECFELAHVIGTEHDRKDASICEWEGHSVRLAVVKPSRVITLCGPQVNTGTCHNLFDSHRLDIWDFLTQVEKDQAIADAGGIGPAMHRCAPLTWLNRLEVVGGETVEVAA